MKGDFEVLLVSPLHRNGLRHGHVIQ